MKRFIAVLSGLLVLPAFAEVVPANYYDDQLQYTDEMQTDESSVDDTTTQVQDVQPDDKQQVIPVVPTSVSPRNTTVSRNATRAMPATITNVSSRNNAQRSISSRTTTGTTVRARDNASTTALRSGAQNVTSRRNSGSTTNSARATTLTQTDTVNTPLYYSTARVSVRPTSTTTRAPITIRAATGGTTAVSNTTVADTTNTMDQIAQLTDFCKAQYTQCMDNFCNVLDDNQGRCSCSANIKNYSKTEEALKQATEDLQDVAQKIQYIGLTKDEISTLFTQTEAESEMQSKTDSTQLKNDLDRVKSLVLDIKSGSSVSSDTGTGLDLASLLDFTFTDSSFDLNSLFGGGTSTNSISNQRGAELYKTATARCKSAVLDSCKSQGVDTTVVANTYDLEIDKQCIAYERNLTDANTQMISTVRNAKNVLQKARLVVAQQKNSYDLRGCINALDSCMQDDYVCGSDYENCLDPSGKYIVNGKVVVGSEPGLSGGGLTSSSSSATGLYNVWNYTSPSVSNAWGNGTVDAFINQYLGTASANPISMVDYLENKIGYHDDSDGANYGMCMSVLNKCQDHTYDKTTGNYKKNNEVIKSYLQRTLIQIKSSEDNKLSDYAESCISDVSSCLSTNNYSASPATAANACNPVITTCSSVVYGATATANKNSIIASAGGAVCPSNSTYDSSKTAISTGSTTTYAVVSASYPSGVFCTCNKVGASVSGVCPV